MNKICTSLEQSKKLMELGIDVNTADMFYPNAPSPVPCVDDGNPKGDVYIPAWSLTALLEVLPNLIDCSFKTLNFLYGWHCAYMNGNGEILNNDTTADNPVDACYEMIIKLKEQNLIWKQR